MYNGLQQLLRGYEKFTDFAQRNKLRAGVSSFASFTSGLGGIIIARIFFPDLISLGLSDSLTVGIMMLSAYLAVIGLLGSCVTQDKYYNSPKCPFCDHTAPSGTAWCTHCQKDLLVNCTNCGEYVPVADATCKFCKVPHAQVLAVK